MKIERIIVGDLQTNCYLIIGTENALIIDPGEDADVISRRINDFNVTPSALFATHGHFDHILAAAELQLVYSIPFLMNRKDEFLLPRMKSSAQHFTGVSEVSPPPTITQTVDKGIFRVDEFELEIIHLPGHTPGSLGFYFKKESALFVGDVIFADGFLGRTDFRYSNKSELLASIRAVRAFPSGTTVYPGHGDFFLL